MEYSVNTFHDLGKRFKACSHWYRTRILSIEWRQVLGKSEPDCRIENRSIYVTLNARWNLSFGVQRMSRVFLLIARYPCPII
jgi:hypothetical protein